MQFLLLWLLPQNSKYPCSWDAPILAEAKVPTCPFVCPSAIFLDLIPPILQTTWAVISPLEVATPGPLFKDNQQHTSGLARFGITQSLSSSPICQSYLLLPSIWCLNNATHYPSISSNTPDQKGGCSCTNTNFSALPFQQVLSSLSPTAVPIQHLWQKHLQHEQQMIWTSAAETRASTAGKTWCHWACCPVLLCKQTGGQQKGHGMRTASAA